MTDLLTTNLLVDYDIDAMGLTDGTSIASILDASGGAHHAVAMVGHAPVSQSASGPNGKRYAHFNGSQIAGTTHLDVLPTSAAQRVVFVVAKSDTQTAMDSNFFQTGVSGTSEATFAFGTAGAAPNRIWGTFWSLNTSTFPVSNIDQWHAYALQINAVGNPVVWIDGVKQTIDTGPHPHTGTGKPLYVGGRGDPWFDSPDGDYIGGIARILGHGTLTDAEIIEQFQYIDEVYFGASPPPLAVGYALSGRLDQWGYYPRILTDAEAASQFNEGAGTTATGGGGTAFTPQAPSAPTTTLPAGDVASRPETAADGQLWFNTDAEQLERWDGSAWTPAAPPIGYVQPAHGCRIYRSTTQSIPNNTLTAISFDAEHWDTDAYHEAITNPTRITIPTGRAGYYLMTGHVELDLNATGSRSVAVAFNGTRNIAQHDTQGSGSGIPRVTVSSVYFLDEGDYVELAVLETSGGALDVHRVADVSPEFSAVLLGT